MLMAVLARSGEWVTPGICCKPAGMSIEQTECSAQEWKKCWEIWVSLLEEEHLVSHKNTRETVSNPIHWKDWENKLTLHHAVSISCLELHWNKLILLKPFSAVSKNVKRGSYPHECPNNATVPEQNRKRCYLGGYRWKSKFWIMSGNHKNLQRSRTV